MKSYFHMDLQTATDFKIHMRLNHAIGKKATGERTKDQLEAFHKLLHTVKDKTNTHPNMVMSGEYSGYTPNGY